MEGVIDCQGDHRATFNNKNLIGLYVDNTNEKCTEMEGVTDCQGDHRATINNRNLIGL